MRNKTIKFQSREDMTRGKVMWAEELREALFSKDGSKKLKRKIQTVEDANLVRRRLGYKLAEIKKGKRGHLTAVLEKAGMSSTQRSRYAIIGNKVPKDPPILKIQKYVELSDAIVDAFGLDKDVFLFEIFEDVSLDESDKSEAKSQEISDLVYNVQRMGKEIAERTNLLNFFERVANTPGTLNEKGEIVSAHMLNVLRDRSFQGRYDHFTEPQPIPVVPLYGVLERRFSGVAYISGWEKEPDDGASNVFFENLATECFKNKGKMQTPIIVEIWREIGLALGESHQKGSLDAMFSGKCYVKAWIDGELVSFPDNYTAGCFYDMFYPPALVFKDGCWAACKAELENIDDFYETWKYPDYPEDNTLGFMGEYDSTSYHKIDEWHVNELLNNFKMHETELFCLANFNDIPDDYKFRLQLEIGKSFEWTMYSGKLETAMVEVIHEWQAKLTRYKSKRQTDFQEQDAVMFKRWAEETPTTPPYIISQEEP